MEVIVVPGVAGTDQSPENFLTLLQSFDQEPEEARVNGSRAARRRSDVPVAGDPHLEGAAQVLGQRVRERLRLGGGTEIETDDIDRVAERVLAQSVVAVPRAP